jgi:hypothetical protein
MLSGFRYGPTLSIGVETPVVRKRRAFVSVFSVQYLRMKRQPNDDPQTRTRTYVLIRYLLHDNLGSGRDAGIRTAAAEREQR